jgi:hypothetical protein|tara:strand:- start:542 stop:727 length:186 start_codon:yes stop_codon:yes gene_type:complete
MMGWFGKKKEETVEVVSKDLTNNEKSLIDIPVGNKSTNIIYQGPMSGMKEAVDKWNMENKK